MLDEQGPGQDGAPHPVRRVHVGWKVGDGELRATVRDDGPGVLRRTAPRSRRIVAEGRRAERFMTTPRDLLIVTLDVAPMRPLERGICRSRSREPS